MTSLLVFAFLLTDKAVDILVTGLVRAGYSVRPAIQHLSFKGDTSAATALEVSTNMEKPLSPLFKKVQEVLKENGLLWHGIVVQEGGSSAFATSNIVLPKKTALERVADKAEEDIG